jgi:hypothetical protein
MAKSDGKGAVAGVIAAAGAAAEKSEVEQLDLLMPPTRANMTTSEIARVEASIRHDRRGRPPGARNVATRQMVDFLVKTMGDPLMSRWRWGMHTPESLSIELGCTKLEALTFLDKLWADLARYVHAQMAQVDSAGNAVTPRLTMVFPGQSAPAIGADGAPRAPWLYIEGTNAEPQQNQALLASTEGVSHGDVPHDDE